MIVLDFVHHLPPLEPAVVNMEGKLSDQKWPSPPTPTTVDSPDTDSARSTPEVGAEPKGAIPKSRSVGKLDAFRTSLREVSRNSSFKLGRKKAGEEGSKEEKKRSKKNKKKEAAAAAAAAATSVQPPADTATLQPPGAATSPQTRSASSESLTTKSKVSKATSLVRKLSIGRYRNKNNPKDPAQAARALSPTSTSPELSPAASRTDISEDEAPSVASSTTSAEGRQGPEGDDGAVAGDAPSGTSPLPTPPSPSSPQPPPPGAGQSRLIAGGTNKGLTGQSQAPSVVVSTAAVASAAAAAGVVSPSRQSLESSAPRKDRDPAVLETVPEAQSHEEAAAAPLEAEFSPPATPAFLSAYASLDEAAPPTPPPPQPSSSPQNDAPGSSRAASTAFMSQRLSSASSSTSAAAGATAAVDLATTKSQILSITTPALKKQQALEEIRAAAAAVAAAAASVPGPDAKPSTSASAAPGPAPPPLDDPEDEQFGDLEDFHDEEHSRAMSAPPPPPSAATVMAEARARLSQSLGGSDAGTQPVNEKREHLYKILVIGELGTGKTSIIKRYVHQFFSQHYRATIGVDFALKVLNWDANTVIRLQLWDIAGQERFGNMTRVYYKEAVGAFIVFDVTRAATFDAVIKWKQDLDAKVQLADGSPIPCVLLANKCDQQKEGIVNNAAKMDEYCREKGFSAWFETSAKENINIEDAARCLVTKILQNDKLIHNENGKDNDKFALDGKAQKDEKSGKSCAC